MDQLILTEVRGVGVENRQPYKLLRDLGPGSNYKTDEVATLEYSHLTKLGIPLGNGTFFCDGSSHDILIRVRTSLNLALVPCQLTTCS